ncbi:MAG: polysaccharide deacetylase family protein [Gammaproteobacteria bacterium]|nr:polysaccharide deacetylase family protein [Gammaproteobacteria bacterium]MBU1556181.1 polysaccharide deacetylase family protein [Gammaproteobacteria bacterium]MBU2071502.1 polysaccharide deacetylase family protein [Gammaproteobacteria bacterium]MBU2183993.1 polysaccharide deacetylase family protein [Gammaproteobacteria bacterium]MBU2206921.1 polysaccharide deacetylase family protein [Gammaproteobacteria bacterium]
MSRLILIVMLSLSSMLQAADAAAKHSFSWPGSIKAAVSLAYDDTLASQLDVAIPALNAYGLKASFYLQLSSPLLTARLSDWRKAAALGHELGNHTLFHQCSAAKPGRSWVAAENDLDKLTAVQLVQQIRLANSMLFAIDGQTERTFTAPCGDALAGGQPYLSLIYHDFVAIKAKPGVIIADMAGFNVHAVDVIAPVGSSGAELIALVKQAARYGTMVNFTFHGIGGDHLTVSAEAHAQLLAYLAANRDIYWTDTFINIMRYVKTQQKAAAKPLQP